MLQIRPNCEHCGKALPANSTGAMICSYECTFCATCVEEILKNVCPNCGGGFEKRPIRPKKELVKHPASTKQVYKPVQKGSFTKLLLLYKDRPPKNR